MARGIYLIIVDRSRDGKQPKFYIGKASNSRKRECEHRKYLRESRHQNVLLQRAWVKYGEASFSFSIIEESQATELSPIEQRHLDDFRQRYGDDRIFNIRKDCVDTRLGITHTLAVRAVLSERQKSNWQDPAYREKVVPKLKAAQGAPEARERNSVRGKEISNRPEVKERQREVGIALGKNPETHSDPEYRARTSAMQLIIQNDPVTKAKIAATNALPETRARRSAASAKSQSSEVARQKQRGIQLVSQNRPEVKAKKSSSVKAALSEPDSIARRKITNSLPEVKARRSSAAKAREDKRRAMRGAV